MKILARFALLTVAFLAFIHKAKAKTDLFDLVGKVDQELKAEELALQRPMKHRHRKWTHESRAMSYHNRLAEISVDRLLELEPDLAASEAARKVNEVVGRRQRRAERAAARAAEAGHLANEADSERLSLLAPSEPTSDVPQTQEKPEKYRAAGQGHSTRPVKMVSDMCSGRPIECGAKDKYRSIAGTCNNLDNPYWGAMSTPFQRLVDANYADNKKLPRGGHTVHPLTNPHRGCRDRGDVKLPNARDISNRLHIDRNFDNSQFTHMLTQTGQFLDHDMTLAPEEEVEECCKYPFQTHCLPIILPENDTFHRGDECLEFTRSVPFCELPHGHAEWKPREQMNALTAFVDASQVYGSDDDLAMDLRTMSKGQLKYTRSLKGKELLPFIGDEHIAGDIRAQDMPGLAVMHTLLLREHNRIAAVLDAMGKSDEEAYQGARRLVGAQWENIVYSEWLPIVVGEDTLEKNNMLLSAMGRTTYDPSVNPTIFNAFAAAAFRFGHTLIQGLVEMRNTQTGEHIESYRLRDNFFNLDRYFANKGEGLEQIIMGLINQPAQTFDRFVTEDVTNFLFGNVEGISTDLVTRNILRAREHGQQAYNSFREACGMAKICDWNSPPDEIPVDNWNILRGLYRHPSDIELFPGGLAEESFNGGTIGRTFNCIVTKQFRAALYGDRFFFSHDSPSSVSHPFTDAEYSIIRARTLRDIICDNTDIAKTRVNVFRLDSSMRYCTDHNMLDPADFNH